MAGSRFGSFKSEKGDSAETEAATPQRKDPYAVLGVDRNATDEEIRSAYRRMALRYHPDKNGGDPFSADMFQEVAFSYSILSDPSKRRQYDTGMPDTEDTEPTEANETDSQEMEVDLSSLNTATTVLAALFRLIRGKRDFFAKWLRSLENHARPLICGPRGYVFVYTCSMLGAPIERVVSEPVLEEAFNGPVMVSQLHLGDYVCKEVEKQKAHFYSVDITEHEVEKGLVCCVHSTEMSKFKLLYFDIEENGGLSLALQEDSVKAGKVTSAGMYFLGFPVCRFEKNNSASPGKYPFSSLDTAMYPDTTWFKRLDSFQPLLNLTERGIVG